MSENGMTVGREQVDEILAVVQAITEQLKHLARKPEQTGWLKKPPSV